MQTLIIMFVALLLSATEEKLVIAAPFICLKISGIDGITKRTIQGCFGTEEECAKAAAIINRNPPRNVECFNAIKAK